MSPPTEQDLIDAYRKMERAHAEYQTRQHEAIKARRTYDEARTAFYTMAGEFCGS